MVTNTLTFNELTFNDKHKTIINIFLGMLLVYLLFHLFLSERSIPSLLSLSLQESRMEAQAQMLDTELTALNSRVTGLRPETIDPDLIEEYSIQMLGRGAKTGIILLDSNS